MMSICFTIIVVVARLLRFYYVNAKDPERTADGTHIRSEYDFETIYGLPGVLSEYRFEVGGGLNQCFYQKLPQDAQLHVTFQVLRGADKNIDMSVRMQNGFTVGHFQWTDEGNIETIINETDVYSFCFDNGLSRYSSKIVYFYLLSYKAEQWHSFAEEIQDYQGGIQNFSHILSTVSENTNTVLKMTSVTRGHMLMDWYTIRANHKSVQLWSIALCVVIVASSAFQVFFVRRMFSGSGAQSTVKPRA